MRSRTLGLLLALVALPLSAATVIHFDPLPPVSDRPLQVHVSSTLGGSCPVRTIRAEVTGTRVDIFAETEVGTGCELLPVFFEYRFTATVPPLPAGPYEVHVAIDDQLVASRKVTVREAHPVFRVMPDLLVPGERASIVAPGLATCPDAPLDCASVSFNGVQAVILEKHPPDTLVVRIPEVRGVQTVTVRHAHLDHTVVAAAISPEGSLFPVDFGFFEPVLFPVAYRGAGALGSQWETEISLRNDNNHVLTPFWSHFGTRCNPPCDARPRPRSTLIIRDLNIPPGFVEHFSRQDMPSLAFGTLIRDRSRQAEALGTEIPVVRERDLFDRKFHLLNVPTDPRFRVALRLYDLEGGLVVTPEQGRPRTITVRFQTMDSDDTIAALHVPLLPTVAYTPAFAIIGDLVATVPELAGKGPLRIEIDPDVAPGQRTVWGFVSVTNNETQHVTVISPQ